MPGPNHVSRYVKRRDMPPDSAPRQKIFYVARAIKTTVGTGPPAVRMARGILAAVLTSKKNWKKRLQ